MKVRRLSLPLLFSLLLALLAACGGAPAATAPTAAPAAPAATTAPAATAAPAATEAPAATAAEAATAAPAATAAEAPTAVPTVTPGPSTVGTGSNLIHWWHISTPANERANWADLANKFVQEHPDTSI